jgi:hypothetical protein
MSGLSGLYHGRIRGWRGSCPTGHAGQSVAESSLNSIKTAGASRGFGRYILRNELASQIEREALQFSDPEKRAILTLAIKHFDQTE